MSRSAPCCWKRENQCSLGTCQWTRTLILYSRHRAEDLRVCSVSVTSSSIIRDRSVMGWASCPLQHHTWHMTLSTALMVVRCVLEAQRSFLEPEFLLRAGVMYILAERSQEPLQYIFPRFVDGSEKRYSRCHPPYTQ